MKVKYVGPDFIGITQNKIYEVLSIERGWYRIMNELDETYLFPPKVFITVEGSEDDVEIKK